MYLSKANFNLRGRSVLEDKGTSISLRVTYCITLLHKVPRLIMHKLSAIEHCLLGQMLITANPPRPLHYAHIAGLNRLKHYGNW